MGKQLSLSAGEWQIMECLWEKSPRTLMEMVRELSPSTGWHKSTVVTMVGRLEAKGAVGYIEGGRARLYSPSKYAYSPGTRRPSRRRRACSTGSTGAAWG